MIIMMLISFVVIIESMNQNMFWVFVCSSNGIMWYGCGCGHGMV